MKRLFLALLCGSALSLPAWSIKAQGAAPRDPTLRTEVYRADARTRIIMTLRRSTTITFGADESVIRVIFGDDDIVEGPDASSLGSSPLRNHVPLWPKRAGRTNLQAVTSTPGRPDRLYHFIIVVRDVPPDGDDDPEATYGLTFTYPGQRTIAQEAERGAQQQRQVAQQVRERLRASPTKLGIATQGDGYTNYRYVARGDRQLIPVAIGDDSVETFMLFHPSFPAPAVFFVRWENGELKEHAVTFDRREMMFVAPGVHELLRLRAGGLVLEIHNVGYEQSLQQQRAWEAEQRGTSRLGVTREFRRK